MKLIFNLEYQTIFGEQLVLNFVDETGKAEPHTMDTRDGKHWTYEYSKVIKTGKCLDYYYSVQRGDEVIRHEWLVQPHRLELIAGEGSRYTMYDHWIDIPQDSYLYSSAITECVIGREQQMSAPAETQRTVRLKVRAPQLRNGERLAIVGAPYILGIWDSKKAVPMVEHAYHEWVVSLDADRLGIDVEFKFVVLNNEDVIWESANNRTLSLPALKKGEVYVYELNQARFSIPEWKGAGTVVPVFSLRTEGSFGVGDFGDLKMMIDWCAKTQQRVLQILPINDTTITHTWQDSYPYNSISIYALHPQYTDLRQLPEIKDEQLKAKYEQLQKELNALVQIDYERVNQAKMEYLHIIFAQEGANIQRTNAYKEFFERNKEWLVPYAEFCYYRDKYGTSTFSEWPEKLPKADAKIVKFWYFVQFNLDQQMHAAHEHARKNHIILKATYLSASRATVWRLG